MADAEITDALVVVDRLLLPFFFSAVSLTGSHRTSTNPFSHTHAHVDGRHGKFSSQKKQKTTKTQLLFVFDGIFVLFRPLFSILPRFFLFRSRRLRVAGHTMTSRIINYHGMVCGVVVHTKMYGMNLSGYEELQQYQTTTSFVEKLDPFCEVKN